jgi:FkbM family methyltransferase
MSLFKSLERLKYFNFNPINILDIGAHKGQWTKDVKHIYPNASYLLIEATEYEELKISGEKYIIHVLSDENKDVEWYSNNSTGDSIFKENSSHYDNIIPTIKKSVKLDDIVKDTYEFIKIDCQGSELNILKGGEKIVNKSTVVLLELPFCGEYNQNVPNLTEHIEYMDSIGFTPFDIPEYHYLYDRVLIQIDILFIKKDSIIMQDVQKTINHSGNYIYKPLTNITNIIKSPIIKNIKISDGNRNDIINYIKNKKLNRKFTVVDIGGSVNGWSKDIVDAIIDFCPHASTNNIVFFQCDITHPNSWKKILSYVKKHGKFSFSICTHTLEDIMNPGYVCEQISEISEQGYIAIPSKYKELSRGVDSHYYRGYIHHRWIFTIRNNQFIGYPKINVIDSINEYDLIATNDVNKQDLSFYWEGKIEVQYLNQNYLGPSVGHVIDYYKTLVHDDDV